MNILLHRLSSLHEGSKSSLRICFRIRVHPILLTTSIGFEHMGLVIVLVIAQFQPCRLLQGITLSGSWLNR
jgi:hypothetical protein